MSWNVGRSPGAGEAPPPTPGDYLVLGLILLVASVLRALDLGSPLWYDEILMLTKSVRLPLGELVSDHFSFNNHPLYSLQAKTAIALFGESNQALRLPAALFGVASVAAVWELARRIADPPRAHVTALLVALSYHHIWYSQNARAYTALMFWFTLATIVLIEGIRRPATRTWIAYGVVMAAATYSHLTAATFFIAQGAVVLAVLVAPVWRDREAGASATGGLRWSMPIVGFGLGGVLALLAYAPFLADAMSGMAGMAGASAVDVMVEYQSPLWSALEIVRSFARPSAETLGIALLALALVAAGIATTWRRDRIVVATLLVHVPLTLLFLLALSARIWPRFFFADMGFVLLFFVQGVWLVCGWIEDRLRGRLSGRALFALAAVAMLLVSGALATRNYRHPKQDLAGALAWVESERAAGDKVVTIGWISVPYTDYFETGWPVVSSRSELVAHESDFGRTWLVMGFPGRTTRRYPGVKAHLDEHYTLSKRLPGTLGDGDLLVWVESSPGRD